MFTSEDGANILSDLSRRLSALSSRPNWYLERTSEWGFLLLSAIDTCEEEAEMVLDFEKDELCEIEGSWVYQSLVRQRMRTLATCSLSLKKNLSS